jgi:hypothetical protein
MADQATFKWGGRFSTVDKTSGMPVSGMVFGTFDGQFPPDQQQSLAGRILAGFQDMLAGLDGPVAEAVADTAGLAGRLTGSVQADLQQAGANGVLTIVQVKLT